MEAFNDYTSRFLATIEAMNLKDVDIVNALDDLSKGTMSKIRNSRCGVSMNTLRAFCLAYPTVNADYILTGNGNMFKEYNEKSYEMKLAKDFKPMLPCKAEAGFLTDAISGITNEQCKMKPIVRDLPRYDFTIQIHGDSMEPEYKSGDEVACRRVLEVSRINWGMTHILDTMQGAIFKRIYEEGNNIRCKSYNKEYADLIVPKDEVISYNVVVGLIRSFTI